MELTKYLCTEVPEIRVQGRVSKRRTRGIPLFWTGSAIEFNITGSEIWLEYTCEHHNGPSFMRVEIDGFDMYRFMLEDGTHKACIMKGFGIEDVKNVRIYRETQASSTVITLDALYTDGEFKQLPDRKYKIEVFGDSVTSGEGLAGAVCLKHWIPAVFSCRGNYALRVANALDADWSIVSQSGWGVFTDWRNNRNNAIPRYYDYVCGPIKSEEQTVLGSQDIFDIENDKTNITIINLGGNDNSAFGGETWVDENGVSHKMSRPDDLYLIVDAVYNFCANIRKRNKNTLILWCYNMLTDGLNDQIIEGVEKYINDSADGKVFTVCIPRADDSMKGSRNHPGTKAHKLYADAILKRLEEIL
ncbi:MAG: hypothetical protein IJZ89_05070 [Clostridia bacterium]|nr:hypothetical protein [Clostridia bacterium]